MQYISINENENIIIDDLSIKAFKANHSEGSYGFVVSNTKINHTILISGDTYINPTLVDILNNNDHIKHLIIECSFSNNMEALAKKSKNLTAKLLEQQIKNIKNKDIQLYLYHLKNNHYENIIREVSQIKFFNNEIEILSDGDLI